ncbi:MAG: NEW3 domain-containing protein [Phycisphaerae bacterium]
MTRATRAILLATAVTAITAGAAADIRDLCIEQPLEKGEHVHRAPPAAVIRFRLTEPAEVTVRIDRHKATVGGDAHGSPPGNVGQYYYVADPWFVRWLRPGRLEAGAHPIRWDGLDADGRPVVETQVLPWKQVRDADEAPQRLTRDVPVHRFRVTVTAGEDRAAANVYRAADPVLASRKTLTFTGAVRDPDGRYLVTDRRNWTAVRFSPTWRRETTYPELGGGHSTKPVNARDVAVDSKGNVYVRGGAGVYTFTPDGRGAPWDADEDYINYPYPSNVRNVLGVQLKPDKTKYVFGPGGGGHHKTWEPEETVTQPGFAYEWGRSLAIDADDRLYLPQMKPTAEIQVFEPTGRHLRTLPLPDGARVQAVRFTPDGGLWVATERQGLLRLDPEDGHVTKRLDLGVRGLHVGPKGTLYAHHGHRLWRMTPDGSPRPFTADGPHITDDGRVLDLWPTGDLPDRADGYAKHIFGIAAAPEGGEFYLAVGNVGHIYRNTDHRLLHFAADGTFVPDAVQAGLEQHRPGNVFLDEEPARFDLHVTRRAAGERALTAEWTLTDFDGKKTTGREAITVGPLRRSVVPLVVKAEAVGPYTLTVRVRDGEETLAVMDARLARIHSRPMEPNPDSPFAMCWGVNHHLMGLAGATIEGVSPVVWDKLEPRPGLSLPWPKEAVQWALAIAGQYRYARDYGRLQPAHFAYGEPWLGKGPINHRIFDYDRFYDFGLRVIDLYREQASGPPEYQFWNEPNFFWHDPREYFVVAAKHTWSMVKARHKDALAYADGDSGSVKMMEEFARFGGAPYNDSVQIHYPGVKPLKYDELVLPKAPEGKLGMVRDLVAVRDEHFPGKPVWNTEEGWWGTKERTPAEAARALPRIYISQIAAGVDRVYWYEQGRGSYDPTFLLGARNEPFPAYAAYAAMTDMLEGARYVGPTGVDPRIRQHWFVRGKDVILAAWHMGGEREVSFSSSLNRVEVTDHVGRRRIVEPRHGRFDLTLTPDVQYLRFPRESERYGAAGIRMLQQMEGLRVFDVAALPPAIEQAAEEAHTDNRAMTRLYRLVRLAEQIAHKGDAPKPMGDVPSAEEAARDARRAVEAKEGEDGYLRRARVALGWTERLVREVRRQGARYGEPVEWAVRLSAGATRLIAEREEPCWPGMVIDARLEPTLPIQDGDVARPASAGREASPPAAPERFALEIRKKAGEAFALRLVVRNFYEHRITGEVRPRLPNGWTAEPEGGTFDLEPGAREAFDFRVTIPTGAERKAYEVGGEGWFGERERAVTEIHTVRVRVEK